MADFGRCCGGGRRTAARENASLVAVITTSTDSWPVALVDLSCSGARLRGPDLPAPGNYISISIETIRVFGTIAWSRRGEGGVDFDAPLMPFEVERLSAAGSRAGRVNLSLEERVALEDWAAGAVR